MHASETVLRTLLAGLLLCPAPARAQARAHAAPAHPPAAGTAPVRPRTVELPRGPTVFVPQVGIPHAGIAPAFAPKGRFAPRYSAGGAPAGYGVYVPSYGLYPGSAPYPAASQDDTFDGMAPSNAGALYLDVSPAFAQVFVDGAFSGTVQEFNDTAAPLPAGLHALAVRADGYDSIGVSVSIPAGRSISYHAGLSRATPAPRAPAPVASTAPIYVIRGCYFGNRPPDAASLPPGCDPRNARTIDQHH